MLALGTIRWVLSAKLCTYRSSRSSLIAPSFSPVDHLFDLGVRNRLQDVRGEVEATYQLRALAVNAAGIMRAGGKGGSAAVVALSTIATILATEADVVDGLKCIKNGKEGEMRVLKFARLEPGGAN